MTTIPRPEGMELHQGGYPTNPQWDTLSPFERDLQRLQARREIIARVSGIEESRAKAMIQDSIAEDLGQRLREGENLSPIARMRMAGEQQLALARAEYERAMARHLEMEIEVYRGHVRGLRRGQ